jgi:hypothetical protein
VTLREFLFETLAGDLEYHPRRGALYLCMGAAAVSYWILSSSESKVTTLPLVFGLGGIALLGKGVFLLRPSSEGIGLTVRELAASSEAARRKPLLPVAAQASQMLQDFGAGMLLLWPMLVFGQDSDRSWSHSPRARVFITGAAVFGLGWLMRRATREPRAP